MQDMSENSSSIFQNGPDLLGLQVWRDSESKEPFLFLDQRSLGRLEGSPVGSKVHARPWHRLGRKAEVVPQLLVAK